VELAGMPQLEGVEHRFVDVRGARLHVAELGSGPPVLLLHGWPQHWWCWRRLMPLLAGSFRMLAMDLRGFGWSEATAGGYRKDELAEDVGGVLDALGIDRVRLVGHDWGGVVGMLLCVGHGDRVERFVPMNTGHVWPTPPRLDRLPRQVGALSYQVVLASPFVGPQATASPRVLRGVFDLISTHSDDVLDGLDQYAARFAAPSRARAVQQLYRTFLLAELPAWLRGRYRGRRLTTPTLWLHGLDDPAITPSVFEDIVVHADDVQIELLGDCGHFPAEEQPGVVAGHLRSFFAA
jgi:pimeloyl-ACP methyl ester carboxylesterase